MNNINANNRKRSTTKLHIQKIHLDFGSDLLYDADRNKGEQTRRKAGDEPPADKNIFPAPHIAIQAPGA